jgi:hypothetical protein
MSPNDHRVFTVYRPQITFTSDSGATDILVIHRDSSKLTDYKPYTHNSSRPGFSIANQSIIYPIATGQLITHSAHNRIPNSLRFSRLRPLRQSLRPCPSDQLGLYHYLFTN